MKEFFQDTEIRPWHGDELVDLQKENLDILQEFFKNFGPVVISGCKMTTAGSGYVNTSGIVGCSHADGYKIARLEAGSDPSLNSTGVIYIKKDVVQKEYVGAGAGFKDALYNYYAVFLSITDPDFTTITAALTSDEYVVVGPEASFVSPRSSLGLGIRKFTLPAFTTHTLAVNDPIFLNPTITLSGIIKHRINELTGEVQINGSLVIIPTMLSAGIVDTSILNMTALGIDNLSLPINTTTFRASILADEGSGNYNIETHAKDYIVNMPGYITPSSELHISLMKTSATFSYTVYFNFSYFFA